MELKPCSANDLISRSALLAELKEQRDLETELFTSAVNDGITAGLRIAIKYVKRASTVDAVEVVRCRDCQHSSCAYEGAQRYCRRHYGERRAVEDMGFCSDGERS